MTMDIRRSTYVTPLSVYRRCAWCVCVYGRVDHVIIFPCRRCPVPSLSHWPRGKVYIDGVPRMMSEKAVVVRDRIQNH